MFIVFFYNNHSSTIINKITYTNYFFITDFIESLNFMAFTVNELDMLTFFDSRCYILREMSNCKIVITYFSGFLFCCINVNVSIIILYKKSFIYRSGRLIYKLSFKKYFSVKSKHTPLALLC